MNIPVVVPIDQRFAQLVQQFGLTKNSFAMSLGKTASVVQHLIDGRNKPGYDLLCKVFEIYPNVSRDWLLLGRGPMLVSGEHAPKPVTAAAVAAALQRPFEPIDLSDVQASAHRRSVPGVAGSRLQPAEIAATLALAAAANQPVHAAAPLPAEATKIEMPRPIPSAITGTPVASEIPAALVTTVAQPQFQPTVSPSAEMPTAPVVLPPAASVLPVATAPTSLAPASASLSPETFVAAALHAQYLQHQLALAETRNQHLVEQQQMLREMLAMARQAMV